MSMSSFLAMIFFALGMYLLLRHSWKCMDKEVHKPGEPSIWTHIVMLEVLILSYVCFQTVLGSLSFILRW